MPDNANKTPDPSASGLRDLAKAEGMIQMALAVPAGCFVGLLAGAWADRHYHQHWIVVLGMLLGAAGGFVQIFTTASRSLKRGDQ